MQRRTSATRPPALAALIALLLMLLAPLAAARAQADISASLTAAPSEATVGDQLTLTISVRHPAGYRLIPPELPAEWGSYTIAGQSAPKTTANDDGSETSTIAIDARLFATGAFATPPLEITLTDGRGGLVTAVAAPTSVTINTVLTEEDSEPRDIKPQAELPYLNWALILLAALAVAAVAAFFYIRNRRPAAPAVAIDPRTPAQIALDELATIDGLALPEQGRFKEHYSRVSDTVRGYIGERYGFPVLERTTAEIRADLRGANVPNEVAMPLVNLLQESDLVKFTTMTPELAAAKAVVNQARTIVETAQPTPEPATLPATSDGPEDTEERR